MNYRSTHGFNAWRGKDTTDKSNRIIVKSGRDCKEFNYRGGRAGLLPGLLLTRFGANEVAAERLLHEINREGKKVVLVVHSNGFSVVAIALQEMEKLPKEKWLIKGVISFSGCLRGDWRFPPGVVIINNYYPNDNPLKWAERRHKYLRHPMWGDFGARKYRGPSNQVIDVPCEEDIKGHSDWFKDECVEKYTMHSIRLMERLLSDGDLAEHTGREET